MKGLTETFSLTLLIFSLVKYQRRQKVQRAAKIMLMV